MKKNPKIAKNWRNSDVEPVAKPRSLNRRGSRSGAGVRSSQPTNRKPATTPPRMPMSATGSLHPRLGPSMMPSTKPPIASTESTAPSGSRLTCSPSRVSGTVASVAISAATASTALTTKIAPHHHCSSKAPPTSIPRMPPAPAKPAHSPTALARPSGGNTLVIVDNVPGMISAAPTPVSTRHTMSMSRAVAQRRRRAGDAEDGDAEDEGAAAAEPVAERAGREQERGQRDRVPVDDPLGVGGRGAERGGERRNRDRHHRHAGDDEHECQQHRGEHGGAPSG